MSQLHRTYLPLVTTVLLFTMLSPSAHAVDDALLQVLLSNGVITKAQYEALKGPAPRAEAAAPRPAPAPDIDNLLEAIS